jgi:glycine cleavage system H protein
VTGEVIAVNEELADAPETVNQDAYDTGWMFKMTPEDAGEVDELMDAEAYGEFVAEESH